MTTARPGSRAVPALLYLLTLLTILSGAVRTVQVPLDAIPADSAHLRTTPFAIWVHALGGTLFGLLGPWQFSGAMRRRFGRAHRVTGRIFAGAGFAMAASGLSLLLSHPDTSGALVDTGRGVFGVALIAALALAIQAIRLGDRDGHRDWMIRSYALGMGTAPVALVFLPIYVLTGTPPMGLWADIVFIGSWVVALIVAELVIRRLHHPVGVPA